jgi:hypothetical protein
MTRTTTAAAILLLAIGGTGWADGRAEAVRKLETLKVSVDFDGTALPDAIDFLRDVTGLNLVLLPKAMEKDPGSKVRLKVRDLSVKSVLKLMLGQRGLAASYRDGAIAILPKEELQDGVALRIFDVRSLLVRLQDHPGPKVELVNNLPSGPGPVFTLEDPKPPLVDEDVMAQLVRENTGGGSWDSNPRAALTLTNGQLVVNQTPAVLREVERFLGLLGQYR